MTTEEAHDSFREPETLNKLFCSTVTEYLDAADLTRLKDLSK